VKAEDYIKLAVSQKYEGEPFDQALRLEVTAYSIRPKSKSKKVLFPTGKPDADNQLKLVGDSLNGILWRDDAIIVDATCHKRYCSEKHPQAGFAIHLFSVGEGDL
jgi:Holliday junction resolvase RusA-like endonuclease